MIQLISATTAFLLLLTAHSQAQIQDDTDLAIDPGGHGSHALRMVHTDDGRIVAAWATHGASKSGGDGVVVASSADGGNNWDILWDGRTNIHHTNLVGHISIAVTPVRGPGAPKVPQIYVAVEFLRLDPKTSLPAGRFIRCIDGPLDFKWSYHHLKGRHVHGQFAHQAKHLPGQVWARPEIALPMYRVGGGFQHMVVIAYRWYDAPSTGLFLSTPYPGARGRIQNGQPVYSALLTPTGNAPAIASNTNWRTFWVAHEEGDDIVAVQMDAELFRMGSDGVLDRTVIDTNKRQPQIASFEVTAVVTALDLRQARDGSSDLHWYRHSAFWLREGLVHGAAFSAAPVIVNESDIYIAAEVRLDRSGRGIYAFGTERRNPVPRFTSGRVGDGSHSTTLPTLAFAPGPEACAYGYTEMAGLFSHRGKQNVLVDPAR